MVYKQLDHFILKKTNFLTDGLKRNEINVKKESNIMLKNIVQNGNFLENQCFAYKMFRYFMKKKKLRFILIVHVSHLDNQLFGELFENQLDLVVIYFLLNQSYVDN